MFFLFLRRKSTVSGMSLQFFVLGAEFCVVYPIRVGIRIPSAYFLAEMKNNRLVDGRNNIHFRPLFLKNEHSN